MAGLLDFTGNESFLPLYSKKQRWSQRWQEVSSPLFAGYVFSRFDRSSWSQVMRIPGVIDAVRFGNTLAGIEDSEIKALQLVQKAESSVQPCAYLPAGQIVRVADGPLTGLTGVVCQDGGRAQIVLSVTMLQRSVRVQIDREKIVCGADLDSAHPIHHAFKTGNLHV